MRVSVTLLLPFIGLATVKSFTIPEDQPNGVYAVSLDEEGRPVHTLIAAAPTDPAEVATLAARSAEDTKTISRIKARALHDNTKCGGYFLNQGNTDRAVSMLKDQCRPLAISSHQSFYSIWGDVVAYACNKGKGGYICDSSYLTESFSTVTGLCGWYASGWRDREANEYTDWSQVGYEKSNAKFCGHGK